jgi:pimeloyl-ACP methyl ester carboxylesterase
MLTGLALIGLGAACMPGLPPAREGTIDVPGARLSYEEIGHGPHTVILIHGGLVDRRVWDHQAEPLAGMTGTRVIRYDLRGFGKSTRGSGPFSHVDDLAAVVVATGARHLTLVGLSLGGQIAIEFALQHPAKVEQLVLVSSSLRDSSDPPDPEIASIYQAAVAGDKAGAIEMWMKHRLFADDHNNRIYELSMRAMLTDNFAAWSDLTQYREQSWPKFQPIEQLATLDKPTLVIYGDRDTELIRTIAERLTRSIPGAKQIVFPGCTHHLNAQRPVEFNRAVAAFIVAP